MSLIAFYILTVLSIFSALMVVFSKKPVHSVLYTVFCFFTIAGHFILLNAQFLAIVHMIVYAGAIMVLFLFTIMFLNLNAEVEPHKSSLLKIGAVVCGGLLLLVMVSSMVGAESLPVNNAIDNQMGMVKNLGIVLYRDYLLPFELISILFLSAMVGAVLLGKREIK